MMKIETFVFQQIIKGHNHYGGITIGVEEVALDSNTSSEINVSIPVNSIFKESICSAAEYFLDHYQREKNVFILLKIGEINFLPIETSSTIIYYATVMALCRSTGFVIEGFDLDIQSGILNLPLPKAGGFKPNLTVDFFN